MTTVIVITVGCLYLAGIIIAAGDALLDELNEREQMYTAELDTVRDDARRRVLAAQRRMHWSPLWPVLLIQALWRLRLENAPPRHGTPRNH